MILRMSSLFVRTLRDDPADAEVPSHRLLVRAGYIRRAAPASTPGCRWACGCCATSRRSSARRWTRSAPRSCRSPRCCPASPTRRAAAGPTYGDGIFRLKDRKGADYLLGPTHEEMFTLVVKDLYSSYKDLPVWLYQIQTKYRDEARPRAGLLRGREFVMKDSYSFDTTDEGLDRVLRRAPRGLRQDLRPARLRLRHRQGDQRRDGRLEVRGVPRQGRGRRGHLRPLHHLRLRRQRRGGPGARARPVPYDDAPAAHAEQTPDTPTIETLVDHLNEKFPATTGPGAAGDTLKNVLVVLKHPDGTREPLAIGVPGDREVDQKRLEGQLEPIEVEPMDEAEFAKHPAWSRATSVPARWARRATPGSATSSTPRRRGHPLGHRRQRRRQPRPRPGRRPRLHPRRHHRGRRGPRRRPLPELRRRHARDRPAASRWATSSSSAASTPRRSTCRCSTRTASSSRSRWAPTASGSPARWPRSPRTTTTSSACAGRARSRPPTSTSSRPARTPRSSRPPSGSADDLTAAGRRALRRPRRRSAPA